MIACLLPSAVNWVLKVNARSIPGVAELFRERCASDNPSAAPFNLNLRFFACRKVDRYWVGNRMDRRGLLAAAAVSGRRAVARRLE